MLSKLKRSIIMLSIFISSPANEFKEERIKIKKIH